MNLSLQKFLAGGNRMNIRYIKFSSLSMLTLIGLSNVILLSGCGVGGSVTATMLSCSQDRFIGSQVQIINSTSDLKDVSVTVGYFDQNGTEVDSQYAITTVPAHTTAIGNTYFGPANLASGCKVISILAVRH